MCGECNWTKQGLKYERLEGGNWINKKWEARVDMEVSRNA